MIANSCTVNDADWPHLTADLPPTGGVIKKYDEDFLVEELPRYPASGDGTHIYFMLEKRGTTTLAALREIARRLGRKPNDIGYAGMKDAHGITRQVCSLEHVSERDLVAVEVSGVRIEVVGRHTNKIKLGHLAGNRFRIRMREVRRLDDANTAGSVVARVEAILAKLAAEGVPNYFGVQRFGHRGDNAEVGRLVLRGEFAEALARVLGRPSALDQPAIARARQLYDEGNLEEAARAWPARFRDQAELCRVVARSPQDSLRCWRSVSTSLRRLYVSALQSLLFNRVLAERITSQAGGVSGLARLEDGDVAWIHRNGACFKVESAAVEQPRCEAWEISPSGPLFGPKMKTPSGEPGAREAAILKGADVDFSPKRTRDGIQIVGGRRPLRVPLDDASVTAGHDKRGAFLELVFSLPPGAYATCVTRELAR
jgi:tRNA pseudouridine13 synthase